MVNDWTQIAKLTASDGLAGDSFGYSVASDNQLIVSSAFGSTRCPAGFHSLF